MCCFIKDTAFDNLYPETFRGPTIGKKIIPLVSIRYEFVPEHLNDLFVLLIRHLYQEYNCQVKVYY